MQGGNDKWINRNCGNRLFPAAGELKIYWYELSAAHMAIYQAVPKDYEKHVTSSLSKLIL
jgi:hypothetical protein